MKNKIMVFLTVAIFMLSFGVSAYADDPVYVTLNGTRVQYVSTDAQPMIYNSRAMVPIRATAEALGLTIAWDKETETATFTSSDGKRIIKHEMRSNLIYVNGTPTSFDTSSIVVNDRILMPIRMLAEATGAQVGWDNPSRTVIITSAITETPDIVSAQAVSSKIENGDEATIVVVANSATKSIKLNYASVNKDIADYEEYIENADGTRTFTINFTPDDDNTQNKVYYVYPGDGSKYYSSITVLLSVEGEGSSNSKNEKYDDGELSNYIHKVELDDTEVEKGEYINYTITTTNLVKRIKVEPSFSSSTLTISNYEEKNGNRVFSGKTKMNTTGKCYLYIYVYPEGENNYLKDYRTITLEGLSDGKDEDEKELEIFDLYPAASETTRGETTGLYVFTSTDINYVEVTNEDGDVVAKTGFTQDTIAGQNVYLLEWTERKSGTIKYKVTAYNKADETTSESTHITCKADTGGPFIISIDPERDSMESGRESRFTLRCTNDTDYVVIKDNNNKTLYSTENESKATSSSYKRYSAGIMIDDVNTYYTAYAYNDDGTSYKRDFYIYGESYEEPKITNVTYDSTIYEGDELDVEVYTNTSVSRVWIEDEDGDNVTNVRKSPSKESSDEYTWNFNFEPDDEGNRSYTIYASNEDNVSSSEEDYDTKTIKIKVR